MTDDYVCHVSGLSFGEEVLYRVRQKSLPLLAATYDYLVRVLVT